jgi:hypothetical protein
VVLEVREDRRVGVPKLSHACRWCP